MWTSKLFASTVLWECYITFTTLNVLHFVKHPESKNTKSEHSISESSSITIIVWKWVEKNLLIWKRQTYASNLVCWMLNSLFRNDLRNCPIIMDNHNVLICVGGWGVFVCLMAEMESVSRWISTCVSKHWMLHEIQNMSGNKRR
jgi:hypothetical protein